MYSTKIYGMKLPPPWDHGLPLSLSPSFPPEELPSLWVRVQDKYGAWAGIWAPCLTCTVSHTSRTRLWPQRSSLLYALLLGTGWTRQFELGQKAGLSGMSKEEYDQRWWISRPKHRHDIVRFVLETILATMWKMMDLRGRGYLEGDCTHAAPSDPPIQEILMIIRLALRTPASVRGNAIGREGLLAGHTLPLSSWLLLIDNGHLGHGTERKSTAKF